MATQDRIRLTGLLTKSPAQVGLFYAPATEFAVRLLGRQPLGGLSEPLGPGARPSPVAVPATFRTAPAPYQPRWTISSAVSSDGRFARTANLSIQGTHAAMLLFAMPAN